MLSGLSPAVEPGPHMTEDHKSDLPLRPGDDINARVEGYLQDHHLVSLENWLEAKFVVPGTGIRFGLDGLIGLIPGVGDVATAGLSAVFIADALKAGSRKRTIVRMLGNVAVDMTIGVIPVVGDLFDFAFLSFARDVRSNNVSASE